MVSIWHSEKDRLADFHISATALETTAGMPWPPMLRAGRHPVPTGLDELPVRCRKAIRRGDFPASRPAATLPVAGFVQRGEHFAGETGGLDEDRLDKFRLRLFKPREGGDLRQSGQMLEHEPHVVQGGGIGHGTASRSLGDVHAAGISGSCRWNSSGIGPNTTSFGTL